MTACRLGGFNKSQELLGKVVAVFGVGHIEAKGGTVRVSDMFVPDQLSAYGATHSLYPQLPMWPQAVQKSQPSLWIIVALPHSGQRAPAIGAACVEDDSGTCRMPISRSG
jgi:hypothetical protein